MVLLGLAWTQYWIPYWYPYGLGSLMTIQFMCNLQGCSLDISRILLYDQRATWYSREGLDAESLYTGCWIMFG